MYSLWRQYKIIMEEGVGSSNTIIKLSKDLQDQSECKLSDITTYSTNPVISLSKAVEEVQSGSKLTDAAAKYNIPVSILFNRVSGIRQLKKKKERRVMQSVAEANDQIPDQFGLIINEKLFRCKTLANPKGVYVDHRYYNALHYVLSGGSVEESVLTHNIEKRILEKKMRDIELYKQAEMKINMIVEEKLPKLSKFFSVFRVIRRLIETHSIYFPEEFLIAVSDIERGKNFKETVEKFSFNLTPFVKVVRLLRFYRKNCNLRAKLNTDLIRNLLPSVHPSFIEISLTKKEALALVEKFYRRKTNLMFVNKIRKPRTGSYTEEELNKALELVRNGLPIKDASKQFNIPYSSLRGKVLQKEVPFSPKRRRGRRKADGQTKKMTQPTIDLTNDDDDVQLVPSAAEKSPSREKLKKSQLLCLFCHQPGVREEEFGKLHVINKVVVHYYCLLFSCALEQNGKDEEGILGFLPKDIMKEINRGSKLKCTYCGQKGATIGCNNKYCKKTYHFPCGLDNSSQFIFTDNFSSMCVKHRRYQNGPGIGQRSECLICMEVMVTDPKYCVWAPCCKKASWFHRFCMQKLALSAGYFFKCPLCNDKKIFTSEMLRQGVFVPDQDASWELEPNAFQELLERPLWCDAPICKCPAGRKSDEEGTRWEVLLCYLCGSTGIHIACGKLKPTTTEWHCPTCSEMLNTSHARVKEESRPTRSERSNKRKSLADGIAEDCQEIEVTSEDSPSKRRRVPNVDKPSSSKIICDLDNKENPDSSRDSSREDKVVSVPKGIRGNIIIREIVSSGASISDALEEMKRYAENFPSKLLNTKMTEEVFLETLNNCLSGNEGERCYILDKYHLKRFVEYSFNYDQMRLLRKVIELVFFMHTLKLKNKREMSQNPFSRKKRRYKDFSKVKESLVNLLAKAKSANLLDGNSTWSSYGDRKKNAYFNNNKDTDALPSTSQGAPVVDQSEEGNTPSSTSCIRVMEDDKVRETCMWCNMVLKPGIHPITVKLSLGSLQVLCTSCFTCNVFYNVFPKLHYEKPVELTYRDDASKRDNLAYEDRICGSDEITEVKKNEPKKTKNNCEDNKSQQSILNFFTPQIKDEKKSFAASSSSKDNPHTEMVKSDVWKEKSENEVRKEKSESEVRKEISESKDLKEKFKSEVRKEKSESEVRKEKSESKDLKEKSKSEIRKEKSESEIRKEKSEIKDLKEKSKSEKSESEVRKEKSESKDLKEKSKSEIRKEKSDTEIRKKKSENEVRKENTESEAGKGNPSAISIPKNTCKEESEIKKSIKGKTEKLKEFKEVLSERITRSSTPSTSTTSTTSTSTVIDKPKDTSLERESLRKVKLGREETSFKREEKKDDLRKVKIDKDEAALIERMKQSEKAQEEKTEPRIINLQQIKLLPKSVKIDSGNPIQPSVIKFDEPSAPKIIKLADQLLTKGIKLEEVKLKVEKTESIPLNTITTTTKPQVISMLHQAKAPNTPPSHPSMSISFSNKSKTCMTCEMIEGDIEKRKISTIYCPCCSDVPTFCSQKHFDKWHSFTHNWITIPPTRGIPKPYKRCKVCPKQNFTRYYCPACPEFGFCSLEHYNEMHPNQPLKASDLVASRDKTNLKTDGSSVPNTFKNKPIILKRDNNPTFPVVITPNHTIVTSKESLKSFRKSSKEDKNDNSKSITGVKLEPVDSLDNESTGREVNDKETRYTISNLLNPDSKEKSECITSDLVCIGATSSTKSLVDEGLALRLKDVRCESITKKNNNLSSSSTS